MKNRVYYARRARTKDKPVKVKASVPPRPAGGKVLAASLAEIIAAFTSAAPDTRVELAEIVLAGMICSDPDAHHRRFLQADLSGLRVTALIRKHLARDLALPTIVTFGKGRGFDGLGSSMTETSVNFGGRAS